MASATFHHFGVPTSRPSTDEIYIEGGKVHVTDPETHPYRVEFLRFDADSPMCDAVRNNCHIAFVVDNIDEALKGQNVLIEPFDATDTVRVAFITDGDAVIELMEMK